MERPFLHRRRGVGALKRAKSRLIRYPSIRGWAVKPRFITMDPMSLSMRLSRWPQRQQTDNPSCWVGVYTTRTLAMERTEAGNPIFHEHMNKMGAKFINRSCVDCHVNNGRALPPEVGANMFQTVMKGQRCSWSTSTTLGSVLQPQSTRKPRGQCYHCKLYYTTGSMEMEHRISCVNPTTVLTAQRLPSIQPV